jgi:hypothetical protein
MFHLNLVVSPSLPSGLHGFKTPPRLSAGVFAASSPPGQKLPTEQGVHARVLFVTVWNVPGGHTAKATAEQQPETQL